LGKKEPVEIIQFQWPKDDEDEDEVEDERNGEENEDDDKPQPGSLQAILDRLANARSKAVHEALNPPAELVSGVRSINTGEARRRIAEAEKPLLEKMDKARKEFVKAGKLTDAGAKATVGVDDQDRKDKRKILKRVQERLKFLRREQHKASGRHSRHLARRH
jgi:hypothetical protein